MYNLIECSKNYSKTSGSLWNYHRDEPNSEAEGNTNYSFKNSKSFDYKTSITGKLEGDNLEKGVKIVVPLKFLSNFWRTLDMPLINCKVFLTFNWSKNCVIRSKTYRKAIPVEGDNPAVTGINNPTNATFKITNAKLHVPVVTLSTQDDNKLLEQLKTEFKRTIKWNKYRSEMTNKAKTDILNYLIDPTFTKVNRLFVLSFENEGVRTIGLVLYTYCRNKRLQCID